MKQLINTKPFKDHLRFSEGDSNGHTNRFMRNDDFGVTYPIRKHWRVYVPACTGWFLSVFILPASAMAVATVYVGISILESLIYGGFAIMLLFFLIGVAVETWIENRTPKHKLLQDIPAHTDEMYTALDILKTPRLHPNGEIRFNYESLDLVDSNADYLHLNIGDSRSLYDEAVRQHIYNASPETLHAYDAYIKNEQLDDAGVIQLISRHMPDILNRDSEAFEKALSNVYHKNSDKTATPLYKTAQQRKAEIQADIKHHEQRLNDASETLQTLTKRTDRTKPPEKYHILYRKENIG